MDSDDDGWVSRMTPIANSDLWMNAGYFALRQEIFSYIRNGEELVVEPFRRLIGERRLSSHKYDGFWACMDTYKEKQSLDDLYHSGEAPWAVWTKKTTADTAISRVRSRTNGPLTRMEPSVDSAPESIDLSSLLAPADPN